MVDLYGTTAESPLAPPLHQSVDMSIYINIIMIWHGQKVDGMNVVTKYKTHVPTY